MASRRAGYHLEARMIRKRDQEADRLQTWNSQCKYYDQYTRSNEKFQSWTSPEMNAKCLKKYEEMEEQKKKSREMEEERNKRDLLLFEQKQREEIEAQEEARKRKERFYRNKEIPLDVLRDINQDLKAKQEAARRIEAEKKLYQHWRINNPFVRETEMNQRQSNLKVAWLDAQIEKQMAKEKEEEEMKRYLKEREKQIKEEEEAEKRYEETLAEKKKDIYEVIHKQMEELKKKEEMTELLREEEAAEIRKKNIYDEIERQREEMQMKRSRLEHDLYNLNQYRLKLRRRAKIIADDVAEEKKLLEDVLKLQENDSKAEYSKKLELKQSLQTAIERLKEQQNLELKRQEFMGMVFDSEAKAIWQKQENVWKQEQKQRDDLFRDVLDTIKRQIDENVQNKIKQQKQLVEEKENMLRQIEEANNELQREREEIERKKSERKKELDACIQNKVLHEKHAELKEQIERERQIEKYKQEEERLRKEIARIQLETSPVKPVHFPRRRIVW
ncbi:trichoplein keratin filament-binding protein [Chrysoperla carnea]|uniref:trichoplein keratin filament-binding protein n=1 Tax=Chrysoperla carnea TaxID=189513 RepID=UPI001D089551|nr:trichoplein keratin filament-binding protein [Chrysoperla carnea]